MILTYKGTTPKIGANVFIASNATVIGDVEIGESTNIWYGAVIRGDVNHIRIGARTNVQDLCMIHVTGQEFSTEIGDEVTIGHSAILHGCRLASRVLVGMGAIVLDGVEVGEGSVIAAGAVLPPGKKYPPRVLIMGSPAQVKREVTEQDYQGLLHSAEHYVELASMHMQCVCVDK